MKPQSLEKNPNLVFIDRPIALPITLKMVVHTASFLYVMEWAWLIAERQSAYTATSESQR
jgi:hypothetical protein